MMRKEIITKKRRLARVMLSATLCFAMVFTSATASFAGIFDVFDEKEKIKEEVRYNETPTEKSMAGKELDIPGKVTEPEEPEFEDHNFDYLNTGYDENGIFTVNGQDALNYTNTQQHQYALVIENGVTIPDLSKISFITIDYVNKKNIRRQVFIDPATIIKNNRDIVEISSDYSGENLSDEAVRSMARDYVTKAMGLNTLEADNSFSPESTDVLLFSVPGSNIKTVTDVKIMMSDELGRTEWNVKSWSIVRVKYLLKKWQNVGFFSDHNWIAYAGELLFQGEKTKVVNAGAAEYVDFGGEFVSKDQSWGHPDVVVVDAIGTGDEAYKRDTYTMNISLADVNNGGIEAFNTDFSTGTLALTECLYAEIGYTDLKGVFKKIQYPVIANAAAKYVYEYYKQTGKKLDIKDCVSMAQQGENIPFEFTLPSCDYINYVHLTYTYRPEGIPTGAKEDDYQERVKYVKTLKNSTEPHNIQIAREVLRKGDSMQVAGMQLYRSADTTYNVNPSVEGGSESEFVNPLVSATSGTYWNGSARNAQTGALSYQTIAMDSTLCYVPAVISAEEKAKIPNRNYELAMKADGTGLVKNYDGSAKLYDSESDVAWNNKYVLTIETSDLANADTLAETYVKLQYIDRKGKEINTDFYRLSDACQEFTGYWASAKVSGNEALLAGKSYDAGNYIYSYGTSRGGKFSVLLTLEDVDMITNVTFRVDKIKQANKDDDWQINSLGLYRIEGLEHRITKVIPMNNYNSCISNREYARGMVNPQKVYEERNIDLLVIPGSDTSVELSGAVATKVTQSEKARDHSEHEYSMALEYAQGDLGFCDVIKNYYITVEVDNTGKMNDGSGSANNFFFQLIFERGNSAYVLANQQLKSDAFVSGEDANFSISTNMDYGELTAVNIIPDTSNTELMMDKLNIKRLKVSKESVTGVSKLWVAENVGWIGPDVIESGNSTTSQDAALRLASIVHIVDISYSTYELNLEVRMSYGDYNLYNDAKDYGKISDATLVADVEYKAPTGQIKYATNLPVLRYMADYANRTPVYNKDEDYINDPEYMLRANTSDRFRLKVSDCVALQSITLRMTTPTEKQLNIAAIDVFVINSGGYLKINSNGEYQMKYYEDASLMDSITDPSPLHTMGTNDNGNRIESYATYKFNGYEIPEITSENTNLSVVTRVPASINDKLNIFVELYRDEADANHRSTDPNGYNVTATYEYKGSDTTNNYTNKVVLTPSADGRYLYATEQNAAKMSMMQQLVLESDKVSKDYHCFVKSCTVQQVRSGVVIQTYNYIFNGDICSPDGQISLNATAVSNTGETQHLVIQLGPRTNKATIIPEDYDIAVALEYVSTKDATGKAYKSAYVFASDNGFNSVGPGKILTFDFKEPYFKEVKAIHIISTGQLKAEMAAGYLLDNNEVYDSETGRYVDKTKNCFSFGDSGTISDKAHKFDVTAVGIQNGETVQMLDIAFTTGSDGGGSCDSADMVIHGIGNGGSAVTYKFTDIQQYLQDESRFENTGSSQKITLLVKNLASINSLQITPTNSSENASWDVRRIDTTFYIPSEEGTIELSNSIDVKGVIKQSEGGKTINFSKVRVLLEADWNGINETVDTDTKNILVTGSTPVKFTAKATGGFDGEKAVKFEVREVSESGSLGGTPDRVDISGNTLRFTPPASTATKYYLVTAYATEVEDVSASFRLEVTASEEASN